MSFLTIDGLTKTYPGMTEPVVRDISLALERGEILVLLGPSGCGKTTILKMIAGLESQDSGSVFVDGRCLDKVRAEKRPLAMVFQQALLFRHMTVAQNISFGPRVNHTMKKAELARRTDELLELIDMQGMGNKRATELSGGQEQRVSLARAIMTDPDVLLLDEPLSALDAQLRQSLRKEIKKLNRETGITMIMVTHDQDEAVEVADRIALMNHGTILQCDAPEVFYHCPVSREVAEFFGWQNFLDATQESVCTPAQEGAENAQKKARVTCALGSFATANVGASDGEITLAIRPEAITNVGGGALHGTVTGRDIRGAFAYCTVACGGETLIFYAKTSLLPEVGQALSFDLDPAMLATVSREAVSAGVGAEEAREAVSADCVGEGVSADCVGEDVGADCVGEDAGAGAAGEGAPTLISDVSVWQAEDTHQAGDQS